MQSQYGWHVIQAMTAVKPAYQESEAQAQVTIRQTLDQQAWTQFQQQVASYYKGKVSYGKGYAPTPVPTTSVPTTSTPPVTTG